MKRILLSFLALGLLASCNQNSETALKSEKLAFNEASNKVEAESPSFYDFTVTDLNGEQFSFSQLEGKRVLIVNTASKCGFTPQYEDLQALYEKHGGEKFTIIGFPCNQFGKQEPGTNEEIASFCQKNYGVSFPMMDKIDVKGDEQAPIYHWLTDKDLNGVDDAKVSWNFNKFLIDENGKWIAHHGSRTNPLDEEIVAFAMGK
ncbi:glutathione peroxidase [Croceimicrobium hydrocarbonivorans]|uniref:Glutathione peroxidase n=1 Tax=Croceimicrobium hydrocarbonivorans TaxID=2761580 RepID=A0A7H0VDN2_9FLAO|nr:glutathione peroxidase [Croceimicrobium hydrocarbonivorans]QNR23830.1 glutathione peroxidase [Croceimicrobium hydrocarbonivorans]